MLAACHNAANISEAHKKDECLIWLLLCCPADLRRPAIHPCNTSISAPHVRRLRALTFACAACGWNVGPLLVQDGKGSSQRGLNHSSSDGLSAPSGLSYQSIDAAPARCRLRRAQRPRRRGMLMAMQIAPGLAASADIDPPAEPLTDGLSLLNERRSRHLPSRSPPLPVALQPPPPTPPVWPASGGLQVKPLHQAAVCLRCSQRSKAEKFRGDSV